MLGRKRDEMDAIVANPTEPVAVSDAAISVIAADLSVRGDLIAKGEVRVHGRVEGNIACDTLLVAKGAEVIGDVVAKSARLCGSSTGKVAAETVFVTKTAKVVGDIHHASVSIEHGAQVEGRLVRLSRDSSAAKDVVVPLAGARAANDGGSGAG
ncbi:MAG: cell shape determination protein CcmA [Rhodospirillales bacterium]|jgi:cytoskeletal protein CcmA (bactofilin family)|nr:cell shape determination protein CcmA [Rhodospirillales bacterium]